MGVRLLAGILGVLTLCAVAGPADAQARRRRTTSSTAAAQDAGASTTSTGTDSDAGASTTPSSDPNGGLTGVTPGSTTDGGAMEPSSSPTLAAGADGGAGMTGEQYVVRLRDLEQRINELKEEIFRSKARLSLLAESVLQNVVGGARAIIQHENEMGQSFRLVRAVYALDGAPILTRTDDNGSLADLHDFPVYNGQIGAGDHTLTVNLEYQGNGYGIFSYVKGYTFRVRSTQSFSVPDGKAIQIRVVGYEKGGPTTPPEERPAVRYIQRVMSLRDATEAAERASGGGGGGGTNSGGGGGGGGGGQQQGGAGNNP